MKITFDIFPDVGIASAQSIKYRFVRVVTVDEDIPTIPLVWWMSQLYEK